MAVIVPAILASDPKSYRAQIEAINPFTSRVQIDITDGELAEQRTIPDNAIWWPKGWTTDIHMMVAHPSQHVNTLIKIKPDLVIFQAETEEDLLPIFQQLKQADIKVGLALQKPTFPGAFTNLIKIADHVLVFAGELGQQGSDADLLQIEKIPLIRNIKHNIEIGWDGGVNLDNIREIAHADVDVVNVGSAISTANDPAAMYKALTEEADRRGVKL